MKMKTIRGGAVLLALALATTSGDLLAQQGRMPDARGRLWVAEASGRGGGPGGAEQVLRMRDRLELTEEQVARLDGLRAEQVLARAAEQTERAEIQSRLRAGSVDRQEAAEALRGLQTDRAGRLERDRTALEGVLTEVQRSTLQQFEAQRRAFEAGRRSALRGQPRGFRGAPGHPGERAGRGGADRGDEGIAPRPGRRGADRQERPGS